MSSRDPVAERMLVGDAAANYVLGIPLLLAPDRTATALGLPDADNGFYPRVLGGVLTGIATALAIEWARNGNGLVGLGTGGAIAINALGGGAVAAWLASSGAEALPRRGRALLWAVAAGVLGIGAAEAWRAYAGSEPLAASRSGGQTDTSDSM